MAEYIIQLLTKITAETGYLGIYLAMTLESMVFPVPSEAVMPFAGFLWFEGKFSFWLITLASTLGSITGSVLSYFIGAYGGRPFIKKFGRYFLLNGHHLILTEKFFAKYGEKAVFISRFIPVVRHLISLPAGLGRMNLPKFILYTAIGASLWSVFLTYVGYRLGQNWEVLSRYGEIIDLAVVIAVLVFISWFLMRSRKKRRTE